eukprot:gene2426-18079_t
MSALKKFLPGRKKKKKSTTASIQSATSEQNITDIGHVPGYHNVKEKDLPKLHKAAWIGDLSKIKQLVKKGDVNLMDKHHRTPLHYACVRGHGDVAQWLCANRANLGICDEEGRTALMRAVECASERCTEILLNHGAETNVVDVNLTTPLHLAATHGNISIATLLLERDARINALDTDKISPLYVAASLGFPEFVDFLLKEYAPLNEPDISGRTALIAAAMEGHTEVVKVLLRHGADTELKDKEHWKATDYAAMSGHHEISDLIEEHVNKQREEPKPATQEVNSNFGSGVGSPFRSTSTQPGSSTFGGPAINITVDSEDDSLENDSPRRSDFQNSWADSESEVEEETQKQVPNLAVALKRNESTQSTKSSSKIPVASSKEKLQLKDGTDTQMPGAPKESKIPKFESGIPQLKKAASKEAVSDQPSGSVPVKPSGIPKMQTKIKSPNASNPDSLSPTHQAGKSDSRTVVDSQSSQSASHESRIPRLSKSNSSVSKENAFKTEGVSKDSSPAKSPLQDGRPDSLGWENADFSDFDSDSEDVSETDLLAALTGGPAKKSLAKGQGKLNRMDPSDSPEVEKNKEQASEDIGENEEYAKEQNDTADKQNELMESKKEDEEEASQFESSSEDVTPPKPVLSSILKKEEDEDDVSEKDEGSKNKEDSRKEEGFGSGVDFDLSVGTTEFSSPELAKKSSEPSGPVPKADEPKVDVESEFSDFSLTEGHDQTAIGNNDSKEKDEMEAGGDNESKNSRKMSKDLKAQMEALGLEFGSSISSFSEAENIGELDASITKHDKFFSPSNSKHVEQQDTSMSPEAQVHLSKDAAGESPSPLDHSLSTEKESGNGDKNGKAEGRKSSKAQYDALGIEFSDNSESVIETESEWEASLRKKKSQENAKKEENTDYGGLESENVVKSESAETSGADEEVKESEKGSSKEEKKDIVEKGSLKNDSEFISDESFSLNTEDQLEELEENRIKKADDSDANREEEDAEDELAKDFNDSDFSLTESARNESKLDDSGESKSMEESESEVVVKEGEDTSAGKDGEKDTDVSGGHVEVEKGDISKESTPDASLEERDEEISFHKNESNTTDKSSEIEIGNDAGLSHEEVKGDAKKQITGGSIKEQASVSGSDEDDSVESESEASSKHERQSVDGTVSDLSEHGIGKETEDKRRKGIVDKPPLYGSSVVKESEFNEDLKRKKSDVERKKALEAMANTSQDPVTPKRSVDNGRKLSDVERKKALEAMKKPPTIEPVVVHNVEAKMDLGAMTEEESSSDDIEKQFERKLLATEMESKKGQLKEDLGSRGDKPSGAVLGERAKVVGNSEDLEKSWKKREEEEERKKKELELEKQKMRLEVERRIKQHQEELRQREKAFEDELRRRDEAEKEKRQRQLQEWEKEKNNLEEKRKRNLEEEIKKLEEEKKAWEKDKQMQHERLMTEKMQFEEVTRRRIQEELQAAEAEKSLRKQEELWEQRKKSSESSPKPGDNFDNGDEGEKLRALDELLEIDSFMRQKEEAEKRRVNEEVVEEGDFGMSYAPPVMKNRGLFGAGEDYISPIKATRDYADDQLELEPLHISPVGEFRSQPTRSDLSSAEAERKLEESKKMREEAALLLQATREKTNALMNGDRGTGSSKTSPRQRPFSYEDMSDYGSADVDEIIRGNGAYQQHPDDMIPTPASDLINADLRHENQAGSPTPNSPYARYDSSPVQEFNRSGQRSPTGISKISFGKNESDRASSQIKSSTPLALYTSLSQTGHFQDSKALVKMQDSLRESKREMERLKERNATLENMKRTMEADIREMQRTVEILSKSQTDFERHRLDMEMEVRDLQYRLEQEVEAKATAEGMVSQLKDQIKRGDEKLTAEAEARQTIELAYKTLEAEFKVRDSLTSQFQSDINDLKYTLRHERETRLNQEQLYRDQLQQHEALLEEAQRTSFQHAQTVNQLEVVDQNRQSAESAANQLKVEVAKAKGELTRVSAQLEEVKSTYDSEVSRLRNKLQEKSDDLVKAEREQFQAHMQIEAEKSSSKAEQMRLQSALEHEAANKKRLQTEISVLKTQLQNASSELERVSKTKSITESEVSKFKEESFKDRNKQDREIASAKDEVQRIFVKLDASERRCDALESELQSAKISLAEKSGQLVMSAREAEYRGNLLNQLEEKLRHEKEISNRLSSKVEGGSERTSILQREIDNLRRELETANQRTSDCDRAARDAQEKFQTLLSKAKEEFEKEKNNLEQRILQLNEASLRYREEHAELKEDLKGKDNEIRLIEKEMNELARQLSASEAGKEIQSKTKEQLENENSRLNRQTVMLEKKLDEVSSLKNELANKVDDLTEQLEHALKVTNHTNSRLVQKAADVQNAQSSRAELDRAITRLKVEKAELESELREEQGKCEMILSDLRQSNEALMDGWFLEVDHLVANYKEKTCSSCVWAQNVANFLGLQMTQDSQSSS